ncbi:MAG: 3-deoxy-7-phosphoheptulonate synthase, partial [Pirellulaceae bacterium]|nr:3-deoxy-7-phosphoheptulonate synthase [Pirellulaceae bacterium]
LAERLLIVMRVYFEKPRTVLGWKGMINDPDLDETFGINRGLRLARTLLNDIANIGLGAGTEFLDTTLGQFYADLISWGAIGARTAENRTDGNIQVAIDAIRSARHRHLFPSLTKDGAPAILETAGNPYCHLVLRGGTETGPNYSAASVARAIDRLRQSQLAESIMIDCSHGNSEKVPDRQRDVAADVKRQIDDGNAAIRALMVESHLNPGRQDLGESLDYGVSVTDACLGFDETAELLRRFAD